MKISTIRDEVKGLELSRYYLLGIYNRNVLPENVRRYGELLTEVDLRIQRARRSLDRS